MHGTPMLMDEPTDGEHRLGPPVVSDTPVGNIPIYYCRITLTPDIHADESILKVSYVGNSPTYFECLDLDQFIKDHAGSFGSRIESLVEVDDHPTPLDFAIDTPCHVVFHLNPIWNWKLRNFSDGAMTTKQPTDNRYTALRHFDHSGTQVGTDDDDDIIPLLACFTANARETTVIHDKFNLHMRFLFKDSAATPNVTKILDVKFDPDIQNNGGHGLIDSEG